MGSIRRLVTALLLAGTTAVLLGSAPAAASATPSAAATSAPAAATSAPAASVSRVDVIEVSGLIDPVVYDFVSHALDAAQRDGAVVLVIRVNSTGSLVSRAKLDALLRRIGRASVPVAAWVGPSGARAERAGFELLRAAGVAGAAPGTHLGLAPASTSASGSASSPLVGRVISGTRAVQDGLVSLASSTVGDFILGLDGKTAGGQVIHIPSHVVAATGGGTPHRAPDIQARFGRLSLTATLLHTVASRSVTYLLLVIGLLLIVLEFFTAGVGVGAVVGAGCVVLAGYGIGVLPVRPLGLALVCLAIFGYSIDLQAGAPRTWSVIGTVALLAGSLLFYSGARLSWLALAVGLVGAPLFMVAGMPAMVRARFSTPTIGRESMIGEMGTALDAVSPEGSVEVRGAPWRARTNRATPIAAGEPVRVIGIDGLLLEVEPETGGATDAHH